jgi:ureidoglycolate lyase
MTALRQVIAEPATAARVQRFGDLIAWGTHAGLEQTINAGTSLRRDWPDALHAIDRCDADDTMQLALFKAKARAWPLVATELEVHRRGSQTFLPLGIAAELPALVVLLALPGPDGEIDERTLCALRCQGDQGISVRAGVWHHPLLSMRDATYAVIERRGAAQDCAVQALATPVELRLV